MNVKTFVTMGLVAVAAIAVVYRVAAVRKVVLGI